MYPQDLLQIPQIKHNKAPVNNLNQPRFGDWWQLQALMSITNRPTYTITYDFRCFQVQTKKNYQQSLQLKATLEFI